MPFSTQVGAGASHDRLEKLTALRLELGADKQAIESAVEMQRTARTYNTDRDEAMNLPGIAFEPVGAAPPGAKVAYRVKYEL